MSVITKWLLVGFVYFLFRSFRKNLSDSEGSENKTFFSILFEAEN